MANTPNPSDERFNVVFDRIQRLEARANSSASNGTPFPAGPSAAPNAPAGVTPGKLYTATAGIVATVLLAAIGATRAVDSQYAGLDKRLSKAEGAIKALADKQDTQTQNLIHDLLATAARSSGNVDLARKSVAVASQFTANLREEKKPAPPEFFQTAVESLRQSQQPDLKIPVFNAALQLAEYRSSLLIVPLPPSIINCDPGPPRFVAGATTLSNVTLRNCSQVIDGNHLTNVAFVNSRITYRGGPVFLKNVMFVNCTFDVEQSDRGTQFLEAQALAKTDLTIG